MNAVAALGSHSDTLEVRKPAPSCFIVGMADIVARCRSFAADLTFFCHDKDSLYIRIDFSDLSETGYIHVPG